MCTMLPYGKLLLKSPTRYSVEYGTPAMAWEIQRLLKESDLVSIKIICDGGHKEGVVSFASTAEEAGMLIIDTLNTIR